jgi:hypothetical protein
VFCWRDERAGYCRNGRARQDHREPWATTFRVHQTLPDEVRERWYSKWKKWNKWKKWKT